MSILPASTSTGASAAKRPRTALVLAHENKLKNPWPCNCMPLQVGRKGQPHHMADCKRNRWYDAVKARFGDNVTSVAIPEPSEGDVVRRIGNASHLPSITFVGGKWIELGP
jgi:hypothetical protein